MDRLSGHRLSGGLGRDESDDREPAERPAAAEEGEAPLHRSRCLRVWRQDVPGLLVTEVHLPGVSSEGRCQRPRGDRSLRAGVLLAGSGAN